VNGSIALAQRMQELVDRLFDGSTALDLFVSVTLW